MTTWRLRLRPKAPWATPLRSDSLFGALCWRWLELFPDTFPAMLEGFRSGENPPFCISDALPGDLMPLPMHAVVERTSKEKRKPPFYVTRSAFLALIRGTTTNVSNVQANVIRSSARIQTALDRDFGSAASGQLFETSVQHLDGSCDSLNIYIRSDRYIEQVIACFKALAWTGFGKKSSTGLGYFEVDSVESCDWLGDLPGANSFMALSHFVPAPNDPLDGRWRTHVTFPKFHSNAVSNVFKGSIVMLVPGSVFRTAEELPKPWYGSMIPIPRPEMPKAIHYGLCFAVPLVWTRELT